MMPQNAFPYRKRAKRKSNFHHKKVLNLIFHFKHFFDFPHKPPRLNFPLLLPNEKLVANMRNNYQRGDINGGWGQLKVHFMITAKEQKGI